jgi:hypothetical protein
MTKTPVIIKDAYRESNLVAIGATLNSNQLAEGLTLLNRLIASAYGNEVGDPLFDWPIGTSGVVADQDWTQTYWQNALPNTRLIALNDTAQSVYLPPNPEPGARVALIDPKALLATYPITIYGNGRTIQGAASQTMNVNSVSKTWFYRDDTGDWALLSDLTGVDTEDFPFPEEFDDYFVTKLAMRLNPRYGRSLSPESAAMLEMMLRRLRSRYRQVQTIPVDPALLTLCNQYNTLDTLPTIVIDRIGWTQ